MSRQIYYDTVHESATLENYFEQLDNPIVTAKYIKYLENEYNPFVVDDWTIPTLLTATDAPQSVFDQLNAELYANGYPQPQQGRPQPFAIRSMSETEKFNLRTDCDKLISRLMDNPEGQALLSSVIADSNVNAKVFSLFITSVVTPKNVNAFRLSLSQLLQQFVMTNEQMEWFTDVLYECGMGNEV
ncbi:hypothetical protein BLD44_028460 [Mastigocladus laminosus UU774]|nr:hypothetical protein BLD44_028460 [Mastigocladus laminosus UU774]